MSATWKGGGGGYDRKHAYATNFVWAEGEDTMQRERGVSSQVKVPVGQDL
jgi:hypothetical protein